MNKDHIDNLYVEGQFQRNGFGTRLLAYALSIAGEKAYMDVPATNKDLLRICEKLRLVKTQETEHFLRMMKP